MPVTQEKTSQESQLEKLEKEISAIERKKLITVVTPGGSDKVIFVAPFDLRGKDPEEVVEEIEHYVIETTFEHGFANHKTATRKTGKSVVRWRQDPGKWTGPFGPTYKIDVANQEGEMEYANFLRTLENHVSRMEKVGEAVAYHSEVDERGMLDLRNLSIDKDDVPVVKLENYGPLEVLKEQRSKLLAEARSAEAVPAEDDGNLSEQERFELGAAKEAQKNLHRCPKPGCEFLTRSPKGYAQHIGRMHGMKVGEE